MLEKKFIDIFTCKSNIWWKVVSISFQASVQQLNTSVSCFPNQRDKGLSFSPALFFCYSGQISRRIAMSVHCEAYFNTVHFKLQQEKVVKTRKQITVSLDLPIQMIFCSFKVY